MIILLTILIALDRLTNAYALRALTHGDITLAPGITLHLTFNRGVSFSLLASDSALGFWLLTSVLALAIAAFAWIAYVQWRAKAPAALGYVFVTAGGASNLVDRLLYGGVVDFIDCHVGTWHWPTFNLADMFIMGGVAYVFWRMLRD